MAEGKMKAREAAQALIQLSLQNRTVYEGLKELRQNLELIVRRMEGAEPLKSKEAIH